MPGATDNFVGNLGSGGETYASTAVGGVHTQEQRPAFGASATPVSDTDNERLPVAVREGLDAATLITNQHTAATVTATALPSGVARRVRLRAFSDNAIASPIFIGPSGVTVSTGFPLWPGDTVQLEVTNTNVIFAICAVAAQKLAVLGEV